VLLVMYVRSRTSQAPHGFLLVFKRKSPLQIHYHMRKSHTSMESRPQNKNLIRGLFL